MNYQIVDINNDDWVELLDKPYCNLIYKYGKVYFTQYNDDYVLNFEYFLNDVSTQIDNISHFRHTIGDILLDLIDKGLTNNEIIYSGGVGEDRDKNY